MPETASSKTVTETVQAVSKNTVKITLEEYNELMRKASRPLVNNVTYTTKTNAQSAMDNYAFGGLTAGVGFVMFVGGLIVAVYGKKKLDL